MEEIGTEVADGVEHVEFVFGFFDAELVED